MPAVDSQLSVPGRAEEFASPRKFSRRLPTWAAFSASLLLLGACATTPQGESLTTVSLERDVHFLDPQGEELLARRGSYAVTVTAAASLLRLYPSNGGEPLTLATKVTAHDELEAPLPLALFLSEGDDVHIALLLPEKKALDAQGSYGGSRARPADASPNGLSERYRQAASDRRELLGGWQKARDLPGPRMRLSWNDLEINTNLGRETFESQIGDRTWSAYRVSPGAVISVSGIALLHAQSIDSVRLVVYTGPYGDPPASNQDEFGRPLRVPLQLDQASVSADRRSFRATLDPATSGLPPGAAYLEVDYHQAGTSRTIALGSLARPAAPSATWLRYPTPPLYFVPRYAVYLGEILIRLSADGLENGIESIVNPLSSGFVYPREWVVQHVDLRQSPDFVGASYLKTPCASAGRPRQGYHVRTEAAGSGTLEIRYELVGPRGLVPPGLESFDSLREVRDYGGARLGGFPLVPHKPEYRDWAYSLSVSVASGCNKSKRPTQ